MDEDLAWAENAWLAADDIPEFRDDGGLVVFRGRFGLTRDGTAVLDVDGSLIQFDVASPTTLPDGVHGSWVEVAVAPERVTVWPFEL